MSHPCPGFSFRLPLVLGQEDAGPGGSDLWVMLLGMAAIFWFVAIRPERQQRKRKAAMLEAMKKNDRVLTTGGMYATIAAVHESDVTVKFDDGPTRVKMLKSAIASVLTKDDGESKD